MGLEQIRKEMNFRELGGLPVSGGRTVRYGVFYRTGALGLLNEEDLMHCSFGCADRAAGDYADPQAPYGISRLQGQRGD